MAWFETSFISFTFLSRTRTMDECAGNDEKKIERKYLVNFWNDRKKGDISNLSNWKYVIISFVNTLYKLIHFVFTAIISFVTVVALEFEKRKWNDKTLCILKWCWFGKSKWKKFHTFHWLVMVFNFQNILYFIFASAYYFNCHHHAVQSIEQNIYDISISD